MKFMSRCRSLFLALPLVFSALAPSAAAQCITPDNLDCGPCWTPAQAVLPQFPAITQDSLNICWQDCTPTTSPIVAKWGRPRPASTATIPPLCSVFIARLDVNDAAGTALWTGPMRMWYSRTWFESDGGVQRYQVWRFLVNGDLRALLAAGTPCPIPTCAAAFGGRVHYRGYVDYAVDCATGVFSMAWALDHGCDRLHHAPGYPRAGVFHARRSYTMVGPLAGFVATTALPIEAGPITDEAFRPLDLSVLPASGNVCINEERVTQGFINPLQQLCYCAGAAGGAPQFAQSDIGAQGACGTSLSTSPAAFPSGFISKAIGMWTLPGIYPGPEILRINVGGYNYQDPCRPRASQEFFYGVTTFRGFNPSRINCGGGIGAPLPFTFVDQGNSLRFPGFAPLQNTAYVSDIILNFNLP